MKKSYTYNPCDISDKGINQMRFELGDTFTDTGEETCVLCDEEYQVLINKWEDKSNGWKKAKVECLRAIVMKLSYEVDYKAEEMDISLSDRAKRFQSMLDSLEKSLQASGIVDMYGKKPLKCDNYFTLGMQENPRAK